MEYLHHASSVYFPCAYHENVKSNLYVSRINKESHLHQGIELGERFGQNEYFKFYDGTFSCFFTLASANSGQMLYPLTIKSIVRNDWLT